VHSAHFNILNLENKNWCCLLFLKGNSKKGIHGIYIGYCENKGIKILIFSIHWNSIEKKIKEKKIKLDFFTCKENRGGKGTYAKKNKVEANLFH